MKDTTIGQKVESIHAQIKSHIGNIGRIGIALYDKENDQLSTFVHSTDGKTPLEHYQARLADVHSLKELHEGRQSRVIDDLSVLEGSPSEHTRRILAAGYRSSYTSPLYASGQLLGFLFFDSPQPGYFHQQINIQLDTYAQLIAALISYDLTPSHALKGAVTMAREFSRHRDDETASHVQRVAYFTRTIAGALAASHGLSDEDIEFLFQFAGLHDIGKIAVPDNILFKPGRLSADEYAVAQTHVAKGGEMVDVMVREFGLDNVAHSRMLREVILNHHERWDGKGYGSGLAGEDIPLPGRLVAVADVFDALTSPRPYKEAWSLERALQYLCDNAGSQFDPQCVRAAENRFDEFRAIHQRFNSELC